MRLTNERKFFAGVLSLAVVGLVADRLFFAAASPASAYAVEPSSGSGLTGQPSGASAERESVSFAAPIPVARQFGVIASLAANDLDGFSVPAKWQEAIEHHRLISQAKPVAAPEAKADDAVAEQWSRNKKLSSIVRFNGQAKAVVSGRSLKVGDVLEGLVLDELNEESGSATFADPSGKVRVVLELPRPDNSQH